MGNTNQYGDYYGFRVVEIRPDSPSEKAGLRVSTDYIIAINGNNLNELETHEITRLVAANENKALRLNVWNSQEGANREVYLTPSRDWPGEGLLGVIIRYDRFDADQKSSEQNMAFDQLYEGEGETPQFRTDRTTPQRSKSFKDPAAENGNTGTPNNNSSFFGSIPGLKSFKSTNNMNPPSGNIDMDHEFSFDSIYAGDSFQEGNPLSKSKPGSSTKAPKSTTNSPVRPPAEETEFAGTNTLAKNKNITPVKSGNLEGNKETTPVKSPAEETPQKRQSLTKTLTQSVFNWRISSDK